MTARERLRRTLRFEQGADRLPVLEWAPWWDKTQTRFEAEGMKPGMELTDSHAWFGLDRIYSVGLALRGSGFPREQSFGSGVIADERDYERILPLLYPERGIEEVCRFFERIRSLPDADERLTRFSVEGFFWFPRTLLGIERHLYAFYDQPELLHRINSDLADFELRMIRALFPHHLPDIFGLAEDMSYNHGPMLSRDCFYEFCRPYYLRVLGEAGKYGVPIMIDSDGDVTRMVPWLFDSCCDGVYPLERQAGVDVKAMRAEWPHLLMLGGYDKTVMHLGEAAMRAEFERLLPVMRSGGFVPGVDHQTPPDVSLEQYRVFLRLLNEYAVRAVS